MASVGRQQKYTDPEVMREKIRAYFKDCEGRIVYGKDGNPLVNKMGNLVLEGKKQPTQAGLALALGFRNRCSLWEYRNRPKFRDVMDEAMLYIEESTEQRLYDRDGATGARFSLACNFKWRSDAEQEAKATTVNIICDIPKEARPQDAAPATEEAEVDGGKA